MPVIVKDYTWRQSDEVVTVQVPLKGIHHSKVDVFTLDDYLKASFPPFIFEVFLSSAVNDAQSKCIKCDAEIVFELHKSVPGDWETLEAKLTKQEMKERREQNVDRAHKKAEAEKKAHSEKCAELQRLAVRKQIALDSCQLKEIKDMKDYEKETAMHELEVWKAEQSNKINNASRPLMVKSKIDLPIAGKSEDQEEESVELKKKKKKKRVQDRKPSQFFINLRKREETPAPATRSGGSINVTFTPRVFPTPSRESHHVEEEEWLKKQVEARRKVGFVVEDLTPEEQDPMWLKEKGDSFYKVKNYLGAISAYSHAIKLGSKMPALYSNRSAAHIALGNLHKAIEDCSTALELLTPCVDLNADSRAKCHVRRGSALCRIGLAKHGIPDLEAAVKLQPNNRKLREDLRKARRMLENDSSDSS